MSNLSISDAWDETREVIAREGRLIVSVALALFVLPGIVLNLSMPEVAEGQLPEPGPWIAIGLVVMLLSLAGQLAVIRLAMSPQVTVQDAIRHAARRAPSYLAAVILWTLPIVVVGFALAVPVLAHPKTPNPGALLALLVLFPVFTFFSVRFILGSPVASAEPVGPIEILRRSWDMTAGHWWALFGFLFLFGVAVLTLVLSAEFVTGIIVRFLFNETGPWTISSLIVALVSQSASAAAYSTVFVMMARIYLQLAGAGSASVPKSGT